MFRSDRLNSMMNKRGIGPGELEYMAEVSRSQIWYLQNDQKPNVSGVILGQIARVLDCSVDYLLDMTDDPTPPSKRELPVALRELWEEYQKLSPLNKVMIQQACEMMTEAQRKETNAQRTRRLKALLDEMEERYGVDAVNELAERRLKELGVLHPGDDDQRDHMQQALFA